MLPPRTKWRIAELDEAAATRIAAAVDLHPIVARLLVIRGIRTPEEASRFLHADKSMYHDPYQMVGMKEAVDRIQSAVQSGEKIRVYGDYDADGVTSTALMVRALQKLRANVDYYIPHRVKEGYGMHQAAIDQARQAGISLIVTVDNGISSKAEVAYARQQGIDVVVTDHHEPPAELPDRAAAVINPKQPGCTYPFKHLAGAGVACKLAEALCGQVEPEWTALAAIGTVADLMPLHDENRVLVKSGLDFLRSQGFTGIDALLDAAGSGDRAQMSEMTIAFQLAPRINAAGRMQHADPAVRLMLTEDQMEAAALARELDEWNRKRQRLVEVTTAEAMEMIEREQQADDRVIVTAKAGWNVGIAGIVASKIVEQKHRPAIVLAIDPDTGVAKGSARSIDAFDMHDALTACADLLDHFGGHKAAGGMTLKAERIDLFRLQMNKLAQDRLTADDLIPVSIADMELRAEDATADLLEQLDRLAPFGVGNPPPRFVFRQLPVRQMRRLGKKRNHLKLQFSVSPPSDNSATVQPLEAIAFGRGDAEERISPHAGVHVYGELGWNEWNGVRKPQLMVQDLAVVEPQVFDWRGIGNVQERLRSGSAFRTRIGLTRERALLYSDHERAAELDMRHIETPTACEQMSAEEREAISDLILLSVPDNVPSLCRLVSQLPRLERIFAVFRNDGPMRTVPGREVFKQVYRALRRDQVWNIVNEHVLRRGAAAFRIDANGFRFILDVFEERGLLVRSGTRYEAVSSPARTELEASPLYRQRMLQQEVEDRLLRASGAELSRWLLGLITEGRRIDSAKLEAAATANVRYE